MSQRFVELDYPDASTNQYGLRFDSLTVWQAVSPLCLNSIYKVSLLLLLCLFMVGAGAGERFGRALGNSPCLIRRTQHLVVGSLIMTDRLQFLPLAVGVNC